MSDLTAKKEKAELIVRQHADMIYRIALQNLKNEADAQDVFQEVSLSLLTKNAPLFDDVHIKHWLIRVTINKCKNLRKSVWHSKVESISDHTNLQPEHSKGIMDELYCLPANYRNIIYLYYYEDYTVPEIALILNKSKNTVNSQLQRARKRLRKILEEGDSL